MENKENDVGILKAKLKLKGAKTSGSKKVLNERLQLWEHFKLDRKLFMIKKVPASSHISLPDFKSTEWATLRQLNHKTLAFLNINEIDVWFNERMAKASKIRGRNMALNNFLKEIYFIKVNSNFFIKGNCRAETKKNVVYLIKLHLNNTSGVIKQATCNCPAGIGFSAACKHVAALLFVIEQYGVTGIILEQQCVTSQLQKWHHPGNYKPTGKHIFREIMNQTPLEKVEISKSKTENLMNLFINSKIPTKMTRDRNINPTGFLNDHLYVDNYAVHRLNAINCVDEFMIYSIEKNTKDQSKSQLWIKHRKSRITASNIGDIVSTVKSEKMSAKIARRIIESKSINTPCIRHGKDTEDTAIAVYCNITDNKVERCGLFIDKKINYLAATPDGIINNKIVLEVKCPFRDDLQGVSYISKDGKLKESHKYYFQVQFQMYVTSLETCHFFVYTSKEYLLQEIIYDNVFCDNCKLLLDKYYTKVFANEYFLLNCDE